MGNQKMTDQLKLMKEGAARSNPAALAEGVAQILANSHDDGDVRQLYLEWAIDHWAAIELGRYTYVFDRCFAALTSPVEYNDLDNHAWPVEWTGANAIAHTSQNVNYVYVRKPVEEIHKYLNLPVGELHIYRFWEIPKNDEVRNMRAGHWADHPPGKYGPSKPTLEWLVEREGTTYNDSRDRAWIAAQGLFGVAGGMIGNYHDFKSALFYLSALATELDVPQITEGK